VGDGVIEIVAVGTGVLERAGVLEGAGVAVALRADVFVSVMAVTVGKGV
jgi:hypothetical protein